MRYLLIVLICILPQALAANTPSNLDVIAGLLDEVREATEIEMDSTSQIKTNSDHNSLTEKLETDFSENYEIAKGNEYNFMLSIDSISVKYLTGEITERQIEVYANLYKAEDEKFIEISINKSYKDTINIDNIDQLEDKDFPFTIGKKIEAEESSFWDDVLEPAVFVGAAAVTVYLLFTVRSG